MGDEESLRLANTIVHPHGLSAKFLGEARSVGVGGDFRTYTRVLVLIGPHPGNEVLASLATEISNQTGINRVTFQLAAATS